MNRGVQIINQLRTDGRLRHKQLDGGKSIARIALKHRKVSPMFLGGLEVRLAYGCFVRAGETRERFHRSRKQSTQFLTERAARVRGELLRRIREHEFVTSSTASD
jgi:hypothetical protein